MTKRILILSLLTVITVYLAVAVTAFNNRSDQQTCKGMELSIKDSVDYQLVTPGEVKAILKRNKALPEGKRLEEINVRHLEDILSQHPFISSAECYLTSGGKVALEISQRSPFVRVISNNGDNYYLDSEGKIMNVSDKAVHVVVATGFIDRKFAQNELFELGTFLRNDNFWNAQIEQIYITPKQEVELVPRVGDHVLFLGKPGDYKEKFSKLQTFYKEGLNRVGWNKYRRISIEFSNQIICTKKEK